MITRRSLSATLQRAAMLSTFCALFAAAQPLAVAAQQGGGPRPPQPVTVVTLQASDVTLTSRLPGRVVAFNLSEVRPQVSGIIRERLFEEGADVELGQPLYQIDPAIYRAQADSARAAVAQAKANLVSAEKEAARLTTLLGRQIVSQQEVDTAIAARDASQAAVAVAEAQLELARIELERSTVRAPIAGVVGRSLTTQGALVTSGQAAPLAIIRDLDPVFVDVTQSAAELVRWRRGHTESTLAGADRTVSLNLADGARYPHTGTLTAAEPNVDEQTGVVVLRMEFANPDRLLLPGMYVEVEMPLGLVRGVVLAPQEGVRRDRRGRPTALVVNAENTVEERTLNILRDRGSDWIVDEGLQAGDRLIVEGFQKIAVGATVSPQERGAAPRNTNQNTNQNANPNANPNAAPNGAPSSDAPAPGASRQN